MSSKKPFTPPNGGQPAAPLETDMAITLTDDVKRLFDGPNFAHLATVMPDGSPQSARVRVTRPGGVWAPRGAARLLGREGGGLSKGKHPPSPPAGGAVHRGRHQSLRGG